MRTSSHFSLRDLVPTAPFDHGAPLARPLEKIPHPPSRVGSSLPSRLLPRSLLSLYLSLSLFPLAPNIYLIRLESALARLYEEELKTSTHTRHTMVTHTRTGNIKLTPTRTPRGDPPRSFSPVRSLLLPPDVTGRRSLSRMDSNTFFESEGQATRP
ncbi:hypothetical protein PUN28_015687 [Cardiocondyla obscurior]|uniref:Uncharacterized protein n=1 Tax=Cardiocondyla obscurior TaxID=286306 RepID=A0AAW2EZA5_9HYME